MEKSINLTKPNIGLFIQLNPSVSRMAEVTGISRPTIKAIVEGGTKYQRKDGRRNSHREETILAFNKYLKELFARRVELAKKLSKTA